MVKNMKSLVFFLLLGIFFHAEPSASAASTFSGEELSYDYSASIECKSAPDDPLYNGGIIKNHTHHFTVTTNSSAFVLNNLTGAAVYSFSSWVKISHGDQTASAPIKASLTTDNTTFTCMGTVVAKSGCWSFLKGGFYLDSPAPYALILFQNSDVQQINISVSSASLRPFTHQQWNTNQQNMINTVRKRAATIHVSDVDGKRLPGARVIVEQISRYFLFGSAIAETILGNSPYQKWFVERFNAAVFENELKWASTEPKQGEVNYKVPDQMLEFARQNQITVRGHNIFWEDPKYTPSWVRNLTTPELKTAVSSRIQSLMSNYKNEFIHWDVDNEMLHWDFYEERLGPNASLEFFQMAQRSDRLARLFMNEYNVFETCDMKSTVDQYVAKLQELEKGGVVMDGIGLEGHFSAPNPALIRGVLDKLAVLKLPIWLTEVDISKNFDQETQAKYLEVVLREGFAHPSVNGIMLWTALHPSGSCYQMCLTDGSFHNLPAGTVVDSLLKEWQTGVVEGQTDDHGAFNFVGFLGEYEVSVNYANRTASSTLSLCGGDETKHWNIQL